MTKESKQIDNKKSDIDLKINLLIDTIKKQPVHITLLIVSLIMPFIFSFFMKLYDPWGIIIGISIYISFFVCLWFAISRLVTRDIYKSQVINLTELILKQISINDESHISQHNDLANYLLNHISIIFENEKLQSKLLLTDQQFAKIELEHIGNIAVISPDLRNIAENKKFLNVVIENIEKNKKCYIYYLPNDKKTIKDNIKYIKQVLVSRELLADKFKPIFLPRELFWLTATSHIVVLNYNKENNQIPSIYLEIPVDDKSNIKNIASYWIEFSIKSTNEFLACFDNLDNYPDYRKKNRGN